MLVIFLSAVLVYSVRVGGFILKLPPNAATFWERSFRFVPICIFPALVVSALYRQPENLSPKLLALLVGGFVALRTKHIGWSILAGLAALWLVLFISP